MSQPIIKAEGLGKKYVIDHQQEGRSRYDSLRDTLMNGVRAVGRRFTRSAPPDGWQKREEFWALRDVSFEVQPGEVVGIIGRNGAGKSTLLKILSRITEPTTGEVVIRGRVASLLEVGTGFHPELTGRENVFLNGTILGMSRAEIRKKFDEIVAFAEVERFLDTPVKRYSSGMYMRLAFAVAAHLEPEILVVDEVLAVGDFQFQRKCIGKMSDVARQGRTVLFVSHNMVAVTRLCKRVIILDRGCVMLDTADIGAGVQSYSSQGDVSGEVWERDDRPVTSNLVIERVECSLSGVQPKLRLEVSARFRSIGTHKPAFMAVESQSMAGDIIWQTIPQVVPFIAPTDLPVDVCVEIDLPPHIPGTYSLSVWVGSHHTETLDFVRSCVQFAIVQSPTEGRTFQHAPDHGYVVPQSRIRSSQLLSSLSPNVMRHDEFSIVHT